MILPRSKYGWIAVLVHPLVVFGIRLIALVIPLSGCNVEVCDLGLAFRLLDLWRGLILGFADQHWFWVFGPGLLNIVGFILNSLTLYWLGSMFEQWKLKNQSVSR